MSDARWVRIDRLLQSALGRPQHEREAFIRDACTDDDGVRDEVLSLLAHAGSADRFLEPPPKREPLPPGARLGAYEIRAHIGEGGMGDVYRATDAKLRRDIALKVLPSDASNADRRDRFAREARAIAALNHPGIVTIHSVEEDDGVHFLTMELVEGRTLAEAISPGGLPLPRLLDIAIPLADAIGAAHGRGVVHRDIKPGNVMVTREGRIKVLDFGLAKLRTPDGHLGAPTTVEHEHQTREGSIVGTCAYMSPEQAEGGDVDHRSDVFSLGVLIYELATGVRPFKGDSAIAVLSSIVKDTPVPVASLRPDLPAGLSRIVNRCLAKDPGRRYQSVLDLRNDLEELQLSSNVDAPAHDAQVAIGLIRRHRERFIGAGLLLAAIAIVILIWPRAEGPARSDDRASSGPYSVQPLTLSGDASLGVVSTDGKFVAYVRRIGIESSLWVRQLPGGTEYPRVPPVEGREYIGLTMTPNDEIDFVVRIKGAPQLYRVSLAGTSEPRSIATDVWSATGWSADGRHFTFTRTHRSRSLLMIADADGSNQRTLAIARENLVFIGANAVPAAVGRPSWSRDGRHVMVVAKTTDAAREAADKPFDLMVFDASTGAEVRTVQLGRGFSDATWLDDTHAVVSSGGRAQLQSVDLDSGMVSAMTRDVAEYRNVTMRPDMKAAVTTRADSRSGIWIGNADGTAMVPVVAESFAGPAGVSMTRDGRLVYAANNGQGPAVFIARAGQGPQPVVADATMPVITPDGRTVLFRRGRGARGGIWSVNADGSDAQQIVFEDVLTGPILLPDGAHFMYTVSRGKNDRILFVMPVAGGKPSPLATGRILGIGKPFVSAEGRVRFGLSQDEKSYAFECDLPDCDRPVRQPLESPGIGLGRAWMPDGRLAFVEASDRANIWVAPASGGQRQRLTNFPDGEISDLAWSPDGKRLVVTRTSRVSDIVLVKFR